MPAWESILEEYLDGTGSRAAAESLRFRIALPSEASREVETVLRLADRLTDAIQSVRPPTVAAERLGDRLLRAGAPEVLPNWVQEDGDFVARDGTARPGADEDTVNAAIEGTFDGLSAGTFDGLRTDAFGTLWAEAPEMIAPASEPGDAPQDFLEFNKIAAACRREVSSAGNEQVPHGAIDRLRSKLAESSEAGEGGASPVVARRILAQLRGEATPPAVSNRPPDVLAAGEEPEDGNEPPADPSDNPSDA